MEAHQMTPRQLIDRAEKALWTNGFGESLKDFVPYLRSKHGLPHSLLWDIANRRFLKRSLRWVEIPVRGWRQQGEDRDA